MTVPRRRREPRDIIGVLMCAPGARTRRRTSALDGILAPAPTDPLGCSQRKHAAPCASCCALLGAPGQCSPLALRWCWPWAGRAHRRAGSTRAAGRRGKTKRRDARHWAHAPHPRCQSDQNKRLQHVKILKKKNERRRALNCGLKGIVGRAGDPSAQALAARGSPFKDGGRR